MDAITTRCAPCPVVPEVDVVITSAPHAGRADGARQVNDHEIPQASGKDKIAQQSRNAVGTARELERELQKQRQFTSDLSHELRTPIAGLRAELEEALLHPGQTDLEQSLERVLGQVDRLEATIIDLRLLARVEAGLPGEPQLVDLAELVWAEVARRRDPVAVQLRLEAGVTVNAVSIQIARVLTNLLDNAQRHAEQTVRIRVSRNGHCAELAVTDDGEGIAEADRERIFQRLTRLNAARGRDHNGTGLGLAIARDIAQAHSGTLHVEDSALGGARFVLRLPLARRPRPTEPTRAVAGEHRRADATGAGSSYGPRARTDHE